MDAPRFDEIVDEWLERERRSVPDLKPTPEMRRLVEARRRRPWGAVGLAAAVLIGMALLFGPFGERAPHVGSRQWSPPKGMKIEGPSPEQAPPPKTPGRGPEPPAFDLALFQYHRHGTNTIVGIDALASGGTPVELRPGDDYRLVLRPTRDLQLRVFQDSGDGVLIALSPQEGQVPVAAGELRYVPPRPTWLQLNDRGGEERILVVASEQAWTELDELWNRYRGAEDQSRRNDLSQQVLAAIESDREATVLYFTFNRR